MTDRGSDPNSARSLRASLLAHQSPAGAATRPALQVAAVGPTPTAPELLGASPNVQRLCESYHRTHTTMLSRSRRQRLGIALLVGSLGVAAVYLNRSGLLNPASVADLVLAAAGSSVAALGVMALLWARDDRRLRDVQGERLLRALQTNCDLPRDRLMSVRLGSGQTRLFFDCYSLWRTQHGRAATGLAMLFRRRHPAGAA